MIRILSQSDDVEEDKDKLRTAKAAPAAGGGGSSKLSLLRAFRSQQDSAVPANSEVEMENALLERIGNMELTQQMSVFYSAYSKVLSLSRSVHVCQA